jgi:hypothetical protein
MPEIVLRCGRAKCMSPYYLDRSSEEQNGR